jgi:hypothetical protein
MLRHLGISHQPLLSMLRSISPPFESVGSREFSKDILIHIVYKLSDQYRTEGSNYTIFVPRINTQVRELT